MTTVFGKDPLAEGPERIVAVAEDEVLAGLTAAERTELVRLLRGALGSAPAQPLWSAEEGD